MARRINRLNARTVETLKTPGRHADGGNLYLVITPTGGRHWAFLYRSRGRLREMGLGSAGAVGLARARELAAQCRAQLADGVDPIDARRVDEAKGEASFRAVAEDLHASKKGEWRNAKSEAQWLTTLENHGGAIWHKRVDEITVADVLAVLKPIWIAKAETAGRVRGRIEAVLDAARVRGLLPEDRANPARWRGTLSYLLPKRQRLQRGHLKAMPFADVAAFVSDVRERPAIAARCLEFAILTAARSGEALGARWSEIDMAACLWTLPGTRMKAGKTHRVPLSDRCMALLREMEHVRSPGSAFVFPGTKAGRPLSVMALEMLLRRMKVDDTVHGFRSTFRDWCGECTSYPREIAEAALSHQVGDAVERAYRRGDALEKRRALMQAWADYCGQVTMPNVVPIRQADVPTRAA